MTRSTVVILAALQLTGVVAYGQSVQPLVVAVTVEHVTATRPFSRTNDFVSFTAYNSSGAKCERRLDKAGDDREVGRLDTYPKVDIKSCKIGISDFVPSRLQLKIGGRNAWLPQSIRVVAHTDSGQDVPVLDRTWPNTRWFSRETEFGPGWESASSWFLNTQAADSAANAPILKKPVTVDLRVRFPAGPLDIDCKQKVTFSGTLSKADRGARSGAESFSQAVNAATSEVSGSNHYCTVKASTAARLMAGTWTINAVPTAGGSATTTCTGVPIVEYLLVDLSGPTPKCGAR